MQVGDTGILDQNQGWVMTGTVLVPLQTMIQWLAKDCSLSVVGNDPSHTVGWIAENFREFQENPAQYWKRNLYLVMEVERAVRAICFLDGRWVTLLKT